MRRRSFVAAGLAAGASALARPNLARAQGRGDASRPLRMVPQANLTSLDPVWTSANITRNHGYMVYDALYGMTAGLEPRPQIAVGHVVDDDGKRVRIALRDTARFHDGEPVRAQDAVASIRRWWARNPFGQKLASVTDELSAMDDRRIQFRLKKPFPLLFHALAALSQPAFIMPERVAATDPFQQITDTTGSGPYRFKRDEWNSGSLAVYERFDRFQSSDAPPSLTSGAKVANFDRVEWRIIPDAATAGAALQRGEIDWYEQPPPELQQLLRRNPAVRIEAMDLAPMPGILRLNHLQPPFDDKALRRALLPAISQADFMTAIVGDDPSQRVVDVGAFTPGTPMASAAGLEPLLGERSVERAQALMREAGYSNQPMRLIGPTDILAPAAMTQVAADLFRRLGFNTDVALTDWGTVIQRRASREPLERGGWSALLTSFSSFDFTDPALHPLARGNGVQGWPGWPTIPRLEELREAWFDAPNVDARKAICADIQRTVIDEVAWVPVGAYVQNTAVRNDLVDRVKGFAIFWGVKRG